MQIMNLSPFLDPDQIGPIESQDDPNRLIGNLKHKCIGVGNKKVILVVPNEIILEHPMILILHLMNLS